MLGIKPDVLKELDGLIEYVWVNVMGYLPWRVMRCICTSSKAMWNIGTRFHPHTLEGPILRYLRDYRMAYIVSTMRHIKVSVGAHDVVTIDELKHGSRE